ncbi:MAG: transcriptional regulator TbsP [Haloplanus sp.]
MTGRNLHGTDFETVFGEILDEGDEVFVIDPTATAIEALTAVAADRETPAVRLLAEEAVLKEVMDDFLVASHTADLVAAGTLSVNTGTDASANALVVSEGTVRALVAADGRVAALGTDDEAFVDAVRDTCERRWESSTAFDLRTPPLSRVRETLAEDIGAAVREDFDAVLDALTNTTGEGTGLDEVTLTLLVAARNDVLLYDISKWGEDVGIASKATFSRTKTKLEDEGLIKTEKVPIDVGRPRLRLKLDEDRFGEGDPDELAAVATTLVD